MERTELKWQTIGLIKQIYQKYPSGGALHIVLDDMNTDDDGILWCIQESIPNEEFCDAEDRKLFEQCAINLLKLGTETERDSCIIEAFEKKASNIMCELARGIFAEIEKVLTDNEVYFRQTDEMREAFYELKKKYIGEQNDVRMGNIFRPTAF